jgi:hypothetical protein
LQEEKYTNEKDEPEFEDWEDAIDVVAEKIVQTNK